MGPGTKVSFLWFVLFKYQFQNESYIINSHPCETVTFIDLSFQLNISETIKTHMFSCKKTK